MELNFQWETDHEQASTRTRARALAGHKCREKVEQGRGRERAEVLLWGRAFLVSWHLS